MQGTQRECRKCKERTSLNSTEADNSAPCPAILPELLFGLYEEDTSLLYVDVLTVFTNAALGPFDPFEHHTCCRHVESTPLLEQCPRHIDTVQFIGSQTIDYNRYCYVQNIVIHQSDKLAVKKPESEWLNGSNTIDHAGSTSPPLQETPIHALGHSRVFLDSSTKFGQVEGSKAVFHVAPGTQYLRRHVATKAQCCAANKPSMHGHVQRLQPLLCSIMVGSVSPCAILWFSLDGFPSLAILWWCIRRSLTHNVFECSSQRCI
jgi:hypothetical protein